MAKNIRCEVELIGAGHIPFADRIEGAVQIRARAGWTLRAATPYLRFAENTIMEVGTYLIFVKKDRHDD